MKFKSLVILLIFSTLWISCRKRQDENLWKTKILAPLVKASLSIEDIVQDTAKVKVNPDQSITVIDRVPLIEINVDSLVTIDVASVHQVAKLENLVLDSQKIVRTITLGEMARALTASGSPTGAFILAAQGFTVPVPALNNLTQGPLDLDISQFFESADIDSGYMDFTIENQLPLAINTFDFNLRNKTNNAIVVSESFTNLMPGVTQTHSNDLSGKSIEGMLSLYVTDMDLAGGLVTIDTNDALIVTVKVHGIKVTSATAIFPAQNVIDNADEVPLEGAGDALLTYARIASGALEATTVSTMQDTVYFTYDIPSATKNGVPFVAIHKTPPAPSGGSATQNFYADFSGYEIDFTGELGNTYNTIFNKVLGRIEYTGNLTTLSLNDSMQTDLDLKNVKPSYVKGYLGRDTFLIGPEVSTFQLFKSIESGTINFQDVNLKLGIVNGMGVKGGIKIINLVAENTTTGQTVTYAGPQLGVVHNIAKATDNPLTPVTTYIDLSTGSNAVNLLNILPDKITYTVEAYINPLGNDNTYSDFAYNTSSFSTFLDLELPLNLYTSDLILKDTVEVNSNPSTSTEQPVESGRFGLIVDNGFPIDASIKLYLLDPVDMVTDSIIPQGLAEAAPVNGALMVTEKKQSRLSFDLNEAQTSRLYNAKKVIFRVKFNTLPASTHLKIFKDYSIDFKLTGDIEYAVKN